MVGQGYSGHNGRIFQKHWIKADKDRWRDLKYQLDDGGGTSGNKRGHHSTSAAKEQRQEMYKLFAAGMTAMAKPTQESINAAIAARFGSGESGSGSGTDKGGDGKAPRT